MTKLTSRRWAIILFASVALNLFLGGVIVADKFFDDRRKSHFRGLVYSVPWARRVIGDEARPIAREIFRDHRSEFRANRQARPPLFSKITEAMNKEPFDPKALDDAISAMQTNLQAGQVIMRKSMVDFSSKLTPDQRAKLVAAAEKWQQRRIERSKRRMERRKKREQERRQGN